MPGGPRLPALLIQFGEPSQPPSVSKISDAGVFRLEYLPRLYEFMGPVVLATYDMGNKPLPSYNTAEKDFWAGLAGQA